MKNNITGKVKIHIHAPVSEVWDALTKPEIIKKYFFGTDTITDWKVGSPITFQGVWDGKAYKDKGTILDIKKNHLIKYSYWSSMSGIEDKPENYVIITYELSGKDDNITLKVTQENIPDQKMKEHSEENWRTVFWELKKMLEGETVY